MSLDHQDNNLSFKPTKCDAGKEYKFALIIKEVNSETVKSTHYMTVNVPGNFGPETLKKAGCVVKETEAIDGNNSLGDTNQGVHMTVSALVVTTLVSVLSF